MAPSPEYLITAKDVLARLGISRRTLYRWGEIGAVTVYKIGGHNRYDVREIDAQVTRRVAS